MELEFQTIAQRKAAKKLQSGIETKSDINLDDAITTKPLEKEIKVRTEIEPSPKQTQLERRKPQMDRESLLALAKEMGLELARPKKVWIKHSYSVTPESKERFSKYCEALGLKLQDALEEALQDWFNKNSFSYEAILQAKKSQQDS